MVVMEFFCNATAFYNNTPVFYKVSQIEHNVYFAQCVSPDMKDFKLKKILGCWIAESEYTHDQAAQIGKQIDRLQFKDQLN